MVKSKPKKVFAYEVTTSENFLDMPDQTFAKSKKEATAYVKKKLHKDEKIISIKKVGTLSKKYWK